MTGKQHHANVLLVTCTGLEEGKSLSAVVIEAKAKGFTEPDPRDDLSGERLVDEICSALYHCADVCVRSAGFETIRTWVGSYS